MPTACLFGNQENQLLHYVLQKRAFLVVNTTTTIVDHVWFVFYQIFAADSLKFLMMTFKSVLVTVFYAFSAVQLINNKQNISLFQGDKNQHMASPIDIGILESTKM